MRRLKNLPEGEFALHKISIQRSAMNVPTVQLRIHHHVRRFRGGLHSQSGVVTTIYFRSLHSFTRRSGQHCDVTSMAPVEMRSRERLVRAIAGMSTPVERPFLTGAFLLSLAAPPTGTPLRGRSAFGSSLKGIPPSVPSFQSAPPPFDERAIPLLKNKKGTSCPQKPLSPPRNPKPPPPAAGFPGRLFLSVLPAHYPITSSI